MTAPAQRRGSFVDDLRTVLRGRDFRRLFAVRLTGQLGDGVFQVALASYVLFSPERAASATSAAAAFAAVLLPYSLVGPWAGVLLDRWSRRQILVRANLLRALIGLGVVALVAVDDVGPLFYVAVLACIGVNRFLLAGLGASLPHVVPRHELVMANAVSPTTGTVVALLGGGLGYGLRELTGGSSAGAASDVVVLTAAMAAWAAAGLLALRMDRALLGPDLDLARPDVREAVRHVAAGFVAGVRHLHERRVAAYALLAIGAHRFAYGISTVATLLLYRNYFHDSSDVDAGLAGLGLVIGVSGIGFLVAAVVTPEVVRRTGERWWITALLAGAAVVEVMPAALYTEVAVLVAAFLLGVAAQGIKICVDALVQEHVDDAFRGRVFSLYDVLFNVVFVAAAVFAALTLPASGKSYPVLAVVALTYATAAIIHARHAHDVDDADVVGPK